MAAVAPTHSRSSSTASTNPPSSPSPPPEANHLLHTQSPTDAIDITARSVSRTPRTRPPDGDTNHHLPQASRGPLPRVASTSKLLKHHPRPLAANRSVSFGKNLNKLASHSGHRDAAPAGGAAGASASRPPYRRAVSGSLTSPTYGSLGSVRPSHHVKRNASAMVVSRGGGPAHLAALKKNLSSGHLQRKGARASKPPAPLPKQSRAATGQRVLRESEEPDSRPACRQV